MSFCSRCGETVDGWTCRKCCAPFQETDRETVSSCAMELWDGFVKSFFLDYPHPHLLDGHLLNGAVDFVFEDAVQDKMKVEAKSSKNLRPWNIVQCTLYGELDDKWFREIKATRPTTQVSRQFARFLLNCRMPFHHATLVAKQYFYSSH